MTLRQQLKSLTPKPLWQAARSFWIALQHALQWPSSVLHPLRVSSRRQLTLLKDIHRGERCFIIGNGPSLKKTDVSKLKDEYTFGMNRVYLAFPDWNFHTTYFVSINSLVIEQSAKEIRSLPMPKFISWRSHRMITPTPDMVFLHTTYTGPKFARDARSRLWEGATVTYIAMQLAFYMGFQKVILIGVDHSFKSTGAPNQTVVSKGDDPDHFDSNYFGHGFRWQLPDLEMSEIAYQLARQAYEDSGRQVLDATLGGKLTIFPKVDYDSLF